MSKPKTFEDYLKEFHAETYTGTDDDMPDHFDDWLGSLDGEDYIKYADKAIALVRNECDLCYKDNCTHECHSKDL